MSDIAKLWADILPIVLGFNIGGALYCPAHRWGKIAHFCWFFTGLFGAVCWCIQHWGLV